MSRARHARKKPVKKWAVVIWIVAVLFAAGMIWTNAAVLFLSKNDVVSVQEAQNRGADCILVLGARVDGDVPGTILKRRLERGVELYFEGAAPKLLLTGDGGQHRYDEVSVMQRYALDAGVPGEDILLDREGFDTYSSLRRAGDVFGIQNVLIVTQSYHMDRALYIAGMMGLDARGVTAESQAEGQWFRNLREVIARAKDYVICIFKPLPTQF